MNWLLLTLGTAVFWGFGNFLVKKGLGTITPLWSNLITDWIALIIWVPAALLLSKFSLKPLTFPIFIAIFLAAVAYLTYYYGLSKGKLALSGTVLATYPVVAILLSYIFLGERVSMLQYIGILLVICSCVVIALPEKGTVGNYKKEYSWLLWGLISATLIGTGDVFVKTSINTIGAYSQIFYFAIIINCLTPINYVLDKKGRALPKISPSTVAPTLLGSVCIISGSLLFFLALGTQKATLVVPLSSIYVAIMVILAIIFLKEKISLIQTAGIVGVILGIILTGFSG